MLWGFGCLAQSTTLERPSQKAGSAGKIEARAARLEAKMLLLYYQAHLYNCQFMRVKAAQNDELGDKQFESTMLYFSSKGD